MTSSSRTNVLTLVLAMLSLALLAGCIADTAEDTKLPWATIKSWEGLTPLSPTITDRYD